MAQCSHQQSFRFITRRDLTCLLITVGFVAAIPLLVYCISQSTASDQTTLMIELTATGQQLQTGQSAPLQLASFDFGE